MRCELCGKTTVFGNKVAHDRMYINGRKPRKIKPNLHTMHIDTPTGRKKLTVCRGREKAGASCKILQLAPAFLVVSC